MSRLRAPAVPSSLTGRILQGGAVLVAGPTGRTALLSRSDYGRFVGGLLANDALGPRLKALGEDPAGVDLEALSRDTVESGIFNWLGPATHVVVVGARGRTMSIETAQRAVDFAFSTPRPGLTLEFVDEIGGGWAAASFAAEYAARRAEWGGRGLLMTYRTAAALEESRADFLHRRGVVRRVDLRAGGRSSGAVPAGAARARVIVDGAGADPRAWVDRLARARVSGVEWVPAPSGCSTLTAARRFAAFAAAALTRMLEIGETSDLRDETAAALLHARPWEVPGLDVLETLAYSPDGIVFSSEEGWALATDGVSSAFALGRLGSLRFENLPSTPVVPALLTATVRESQPLCESCVYRSHCRIPPSAHYRAQRTLAGRLPDSPRCILHMAILDAVFARSNDENALKILEKWGVDISKIIC